MKSSTGSYCAPARRSYERPEPDRCRAERDLADEYRDTAGPGRREAGREPATDAGRDGRPDAGLSLAALDLTVVATAARTIADDLGGLDLQAWATTSYLIVSAITTPL